MNFFQIAEMVMQVLPSVFQAIHTVQTDTGKPWDQVVVDVINHLSPGQSNSPSLSPSAPPAMSTNN